jgi:hypothetical protein
MCNKLMLASVKLCNDWSITHLPCPPISQLTAIGVNPANINFRAVTAESDRYVTVREQSEAGNTVVIIDMAKWVRL